MSAGRAYLNDVLLLLRELAATQAGAITNAAELVADAWCAGHVVAVAHTNHVLHEEAIFRSGGIVGVIALEDISEPVRQITDDAACDEHVSALTNVSDGDVVLIHTNAGTNRRTVDTALLAQELGASTIALTQLPYELSETVSPWHPSGYRLSDVADVVIDLGGVVGDATVELPGVDLRVAPTSGATGVVAMWMLLAEAAELLGRDGKSPLVLQSVQCPGAMEHNREVLERWQRTGLPYIGADVGH